mgnify:CR=1 FL=1
MELPRNQAIALTKLSEVRIALASGPSIRTIASALTAVAVDERAAEAHSGDRVDALAAHQRARRAHDRARPRGPQRRRGREDAGAAHDHHRLNRCRCTGAGTLETIARAHRSPIFSVRCSDCSKPENVGSQLLSPSDRYVENHKTDFRCIFSA